LDAALALLTPDQIRFIVARQECPTDKEAAEQIGISPATVSYWKNKGAPIDDVLRLMSLDGLVTALHIRKRNLAKAMLVKVGGLDSEDERLRQGVATEVIEWELGKSAQRTELTGKGGGPIETETRDTTPVERRIDSVMALLDAARTRRDRDAPGGDSGDPASS